MYIPVPKYQYMRMIFPKPKSLKTGRDVILPTSIFLSRENFGATGVIGGEKEERDGNLNSEPKKV